MDPGYPFTGSIDEQNEHPLRLLAGFVISIKSQKDADDQAVLIGDNQLQCFWGNPDMTVYCPAQTINYQVVAGGASTSITGFADPFKSGVYSVFYAANTFRSASNHMDAVQQGRILLQHVPNSYGDSKAGAVKPI
jgi:hypothetical protein